MLFYEKMHTANAWVTKKRLHILYSFFLCNIARWHGRCGCSNKNRELQVQGRGTTGVGNCALTNVVTFCQLPWAIFLHRCSCWQNYFSRLDELIVVVLLCHSLCIHECVLF